ncbi:MAG: hypothetical protein ACOX4D_05975 [Bacteroidales bacterium]
MSKLIKEFGSDFHFCDFPKNKEKTILKLYENSILLGNGRNAFQLLFEKYKWKRIWMPTYFCYIVINALKNFDIEVCFYNDNPISKEDAENIAKIPFEKGDVLLRINYFGLRTWRDNKNIPVPVIEDHSHDLSGDWAKNSNADWCLASLRKTLPILCGGILWSPKHNNINQIQLTKECKDFAEIRYKAMNLKKDYLRGYDNVEKQIFRDLYIKSEEILDNFKCTSIDDYSNNILKELNISEWTKMRVLNWVNAENILKDNYIVLQPENLKYCNPFSLIILCDNKKQREILRNKLIKNDIYPAVLWNIPDYVLDKKAIDFGSRMLSLHCDGRYNEEDINFMCSIIKDIK